VDLHDAVLPRKSAETDPTNRAGANGAESRRKRKTAAKPRFRPGSGVLTPFGYEGWKKAGLMEADDGVVA
jgi:hypothetical protein